MKRFLYGGKSGLHKRIYQRKARRRKTTESATENTLLLICRHAENVPFVKALYSREIQGVVNTILKQDGWASILLIPIQ